MLAQEDAGRGRGQGRPPVQAVDEEDDDGDFDDDDLIASTSGMEGPTSSYPQQTCAAGNRCP